MGLTTYNRKPKQVKAIQWSPENQHPTVEIRAPRVVRSICGNHYYVEHLSKPGFCWLSYVAIPGKVPDANKKDKPHGWVEFSEKEGDDVYHRKMTPFQVSTLKPDLDPKQPEPPLDPEGKFLLDYAYANNWEDVDLTVRTGVMDVGGQLRLVAEGDYVIEEDSVFTSCLKDVFEEHYEAS